jgi:hypothetical protein
MGFYFNGAKLSSLRERKEGEKNQGEQFPCLDGNLGYFSPAGLFARGSRAHPWTHNNRFLEYQLPEILSYIGFYWFVENGEVISTFNGAHPAAVGLRTDRTVEILPRIAIHGYLVYLLGHQFRVDSLNQPDSKAEVMAFTPGLRGTAEIEEHIDDWIYPFMLPAIADDRVNVFIANEGNGRIPKERVVKVWEGPAPLPSFGAVISFEKGYFEARFGRSGLTQLSGEPVRILPDREIEGTTHLDKFQQILGGFVPVVVEGEHIFWVASNDELKRNLDRYGNARSPVAECGRESRNFSPRIREPAGVFIQTDSRIGWVLFDGRHELSIGANVTDVGRILKLLEKDPEVREKAFAGEQIQNAIFIDGGSAMKVYATEINANGLTLDLLNRVAPGGRNGSGVDPEGLNMYTSLRLQL